MLDAGNRYAPGIAWPNIKAGAQDAQKLVRVWIPLLLSVRYEAHQVVRFIYVATSQRRTNALAYKAADSL